MAPPIGVSATFNVDPSFEPWLASKAADVLDRSADTYVIEVERRMISSPATGRVYSSRGRRHRASAPGEPPAPDTHTLVESIASQPSGDGFDREILVGVDSTRSAVYVLSLELGTV